MTQDFATRFLGSLPQTGVPGLRGQLARGGYLVIYRDEDGSPLAAARLIKSPRDGKLVVMGFAKDKNKGDAASLAALEVRRHYRKFGALRPAGRISPDVARMLDHDRIGP